MSSLEKIKQNIATNVETRLSMRYSFALVGFLFLTIVIAFFLFSKPYWGGLKDYDQDFYIAVLLFLIPFGLLFFVIKHLSELSLTGKMLRIKRLLGEEETIHVKQIEQIRYFRLKNTRYHWITYQNNFNVKQKILVFTTESFIWGKQPPIEDVIELANKI